MSTPLPGCMIGPSEPCEMFQEQTAEITRLRAALAKAERKLTALEDSEACEAITLRTRLAEAERERATALEALKIVDLDIRHHLRSDKSEASLIRQHAVLAIRAALHSATEITHPPQFEPGEYHLISSLEVQGTTEDDPLRGLEVDRVELTLLPPKEAER